MQICLSDIDGQRLWCSREGDTGFKDKSLEILRSILERLRRFPSARSPNRARESAVSAWGQGVQHILHRQR
jgi:hypothetical protein